MSELQCNANVKDNVTHVKHGRMSYCRISGSPHWFIMVESGKYRCGDFNSDGKIVVAFSYVPSPTNKYIVDKYTDKPDFTFINESSITDLWGYLPFLITQSYVLDTWKLTDKYVVVKSKCIKDWTFHKYPKFRLYNVFSFIPWFGIADCIAYSNYHYQSLIYEK